MKLNPTIQYSSINIREAFAIQILAGLSSDAQTVQRINDAYSGDAPVTVARAMAKEAVVMADALISELNNS